MSNTSISSFKGDKLVGSSNFIEWKTNADLFLEINGYMSYIDGTEAIPNRSLYYKIETKSDKEGKESRTWTPLSAELAARYADRVSEFNRNNKRALGALKSIISIDNNDRFKDKADAEDLYKAIITTFGQSSLELIGRYFNKIVDNNYNSFNSMDEYTSNIQSSIIYLRELGQIIPDPIIVWLVLKGLPGSYDNYASRKYEELTDSLKAINIGKLITDLISEEGRLTSNLEANKASFSNNQSYCKHCNKKGHIEDKCFIKYPELRNNYSSSKGNKSNKYKKGLKKPKVIFKKKQSTKAIMSALLVDNNNIIPDNIIESKDIIKISKEIKSLKITKDSSPSKEQLEFLDIIKERVLKKSSNFNNRGLILDSGASEHYTPYKDYLTDYKPIYNKSVIIANGIKLPIKGIGHIPVFINKDTFLIRNVNYVPNIKTTLISSKELTNKGWEILFKKDLAILSYNKNIITNAKWHLNAYFLDKIHINYEVLEPIVYNIINYKSSISSKNPTLNLGNKGNTLLDLYHRRFLHINKDYIIKSAKNSIGLIIPTSDNILNNCDNCYYGKFKEIISRKPHSPVNILEFIDCDILGPFKIKGLKGENYIFTITCRASKCIWIYAIKFKSDIYDIIINYYNMILTQFKVEIKGARLDNAKEFKSIKLNTFCKSKGLLLEYSSIYTQAQNGKAERLNLYLLERLITICSYKNIPLKLWSILIQGVAHIKNRTYNSTINTSPYELITKQKPDLSYIKILGSLCYTLVPKQTRGGKNFSNKSKKGILVGFESSNNFIVYLPEDNKVIITRDIVIKEELNYKDDYKLEENYNTLLELDSPDYNDYISIYNKKPLIEEEEDIYDISEDELSLPIIPKKGKTRQTSDKTIISQYNRDDDLDELNPNYRVTRSSKSPDPSLNIITSNIYNMASLAYLDLLNQGAINPNLIKSSSSFKESTLSNSLRDKSNLYNIVKEDDFDDLLIFNSNINKKSIFEENINIYTIISNSNIDKNSSINSSLVNNKIDKIDKIEIKDLIEPKSYKEAINSSNKDNWVKSMKTELDTLEDNNTWDLVPRPNNTKVLKSRWVYKIKDIESLTPIFKSRFVAKGFEQLYGLNYIETYASVIKQIAWKLVFALAMLYNLIIFKADMVSAFTQGAVDALLYLEQPEGFINSKYPNYVLRLNKALYGLKQSARIWFYTLKPKLEKLGFKVLNSEACLFINNTTKVIICLYVDDLAILAPSETIFNNFISSISKDFKIKNLGVIKDYLGIDIDFNLNKGFIKLSQATYINKVLNKYNLQDAKIKSTPMDSYTKLEPNKEQASKEDIKLFQMLIGSLLYIMLGTRVDIAFAVIKLARFASNPSNIHFTAVKRVYKYLKGTKEYGITYYKDYSRYILGYCDADYAGDILSAKSTSGYIILLAGGIISWKSKLQSIIAQSTTEAEYIAINAVIKEAIYIKALLEELGFYKQDKFPIYTDNNGALLLAKNPIFHERTKHIAVKYHYIRDLIIKGIIDLNYISSKDQKADGLTKPLDRTKFNNFLIQIGFKEV